MDDLTPEQNIAVAAACVEGVAGLCVLAFRCVYPRHFAAYFGCKVASAPKPQTGRRSTPKLLIDKPLELQRNPILILQDRKVQEDAAIPLKVYRTRKEFTVVPTRVANSHVRSVLGRAPGDLRV